MYVVPQFLNYLKLNYLKENLGRGEASEHRKHVHGSINVESSTHTSVPVRYFFHLCSTAF